MTGLTPERLAEIEARLPSVYQHDAGLLSHRERDAFDLLVEVRRLRERQEDHDLANEAIRWKREALRLRAVEAGVKALTENYRNHYEMHGAAGDDYVVEDGRCVDVDDLLDLLNPTEGETDGWMHLRQAATRRHG